MNLRKLTDNELLNLINTTTDLDVVSAAEDEFVRRNTGGPADAWVDFDEDAIHEEISKIWRAN